MSYGHFLKFGHNLTPMHTNLNSGEINIKKIELTCFLKINYKKRIFSCRDESYKQN